MNQIKNERPVQSRGTRYTTSNRITGNGGGQCVGLTKRTKSSGLMVSSEWERFSKPSYRTSALNEQYLRFKCEQAESERLSCATRSALDAEGASQNSLGRAGAVFAPRVSLSMPSASEMNSYAMKSVRELERKRQQRSRNTTQSGRVTFGSVTKNVADLLNRLLNPSSTHEKKPDTPLQFVIAFGLVAFSAFVVPRLLVLINTI